MIFCSSTIEKTMMMSFLFRGFWDRWIANDIPKQTMRELRQRFNSLEEWTRILHKHADDYEQRAIRALNQNSASEAEKLYRIAGMHYNLIQWMYPETGTQKQEWYQRCKDMHKQADTLVADEIINVTIQVEGNDCYGRLRVPKRPKGCVIILNPIDSSKEESIKTEGHFVKMGFVAVSFDGPGQGETYVRNEYKATRQRWDLFVDQVIEFSTSQYEGLPLFLFGTVLGATWAIQGSKHPKVCRVVSVSPIFSGDVRMPDYFMERLSYIIDDLQSGELLRLDNFDHVSPVLLVYGKKDKFIQDGNIYELYNQLPNEKRLIQYLDEGHGCNYKTESILEAAGEWYLR